MGCIWPVDIGLTVDCPPSLIVGAKVMFVDDYPGGMAVARHQAFAGVCELVLGKLWAGVGWNRTNISLTYLRKQGLQGSWTGEINKDKWLLVLKSELEDTRYHPNVVIVCGEQSLNALCGVSGITKYRGSVLPSTLVPGLKVIPILPPDYIIKGNFGEYYITQHDMQRIHEQSAYHEIRRVPWTPITGPSYEVIMGCLNNIRSDELWSLDIETRADSLTCVGIGFGSTALCIPLQTTTGPYLSPLQELDVWRALGCLMLRNPNLVGQNLTFDLEWLLGYGILPCQIRLDTMLGFALLYPEFPKGLDTITSIYTDAPYYKDDGKTWGWQQPDKRLWMYNCLSPETRVLTDDLRWVPLNQLYAQWATHPGKTKLIGLDEQANRKKLRRSNITKMWRVQKDCMRISLSDGRVITASLEHPWLVRAPGGHAWVETGQLKPGSKISQLGQPWNTDETRDGGWLAGLYDGEGCVTRSGVEFSQNEGLVLDEAKRILHEKDLANYSTGHSNKVTKYVHCSLPAALRVLGSIRPLRLLAKAHKLWEGRYPFQGHQHAEVVACEPAGKQWVIGMETSTHTFFAEGLATHNCQDAFYTLQAAIAIEKELRDQGKWTFITDYINHEVFAALEMQRTRLKRNDTNHQRLLDITKRETDAVQAYRELLTGENLNVNSPKQVKEFLYDRKQLKPIVVQGKASVDENALKKLRTRYNDCQELELIIKERHLRKKLSSYLNVVLDGDGYLGCSWNIAGTETGRWSSGKSAHRRGLNLQTVPKLLRFSYEAPAGRVFIQPDLSQAEARVVAHLANCAPLIALFADPKRSVHLENALAIFGYVPSKDSKEYTLAKQCLHAANYMMQAELFAVETGISLERAKEILKAYHKTYPELGDWHKRTRETLFQIGKLITPLGRERVFYHARAEILLTGSLSNKSWRNAVAHVPQATVPDVLNAGMLQTWDELDYMWLHHQGHDSCLVSVPYDKLGECATQLSRNLTRPIPMGNATLTIPVEVAYGKYWYPMRMWTGEKDFTHIAKDYEDWTNSKMTDDYIAKELA